MVFNNNLLLGAGGQSTGPAPFDPTLIGNSVWLDGSADFLSAELGAKTRTKAVIGTWIQKTGFTTADATIFSKKGTAHFAIRMQDQSGKAGKISIFDYDGSNFQYSAESTSMLLRDIGWYHIMLSIDTTADAGSRLKYYINGIDQTSTLTVSTDYTANDNPSITGGSGEPTQWGVGTSGASQFNPCYLAQSFMLDDDSIQNGDVAVTDILDTFTFGTNGSQYVPKADADIAALATTAGGDSFCLDFADSADLGNDISSNANDFTPNSMSSANQTVHTPSLVYPVWNALESSATLSNGNLNARSTTNQIAAHATISVSSGKFYWEITANTANNQLFGITGEAVSYTNRLFAPFNYIPSVYFYGINGNLYVDGITFAWDSPISAGDVIGIAVDFDAGKIWFAKNNTWLQSGDPANGTNPAETFIVGKFTPGWSGGGASGDRTGAADFGQLGFTYTPPTGFVSLNSENLTAPDYQGIDYFDATLYQGNGQNQRVGDFVPFTDAYNVANSAMFQRTEARALSRTVGTPSSSGGKKGTWSTWFKTANIDLVGTDCIFFDTGATATNRFNLRMNASGQISFLYGGTFILRTNANLKGGDLWRNLVLKVDTSLATAADRAIMYIDGVEVTSFAIDSRASLTQDGELGYLDPGATQFVGSYDGVSSNQWDGYLAETIFLDNQFLSADSFGQLDTSTNKWVPKDVSGLTFGDQGFYLKYENSPTNIAAGETGLKSDDLDVGAVSLLTDGTQYGSWNAGSNLVYQNANSTTKSWWGVDFGSGVTKTIKSATIFGNQPGDGSSAGFTSVSGAVTWTLFGSNSAQATSDNDLSSLTSLGTASVADGISKGASVTIDASSNTTAFRYFYVQMNTTANLRRLLGEIQLYETSGGGITNDSSGQNNDFVALGAWTSSDQFTDTPTNNVFTFATDGTGTISEGNTRVDLNDIVYGLRPTIANFSSTGKFYGEFLVNAVSGSTVGIGFATDIASQDTTNPATTPNNDSRNFLLQLSDGNKINGDSTGVSYGSGISAGQTVMWAFDAATRKIWFGSEGTFFASGDPAAGTNEAFILPNTGTVTLVVYDGSNARTANLTMRNATAAFEHTAPTGFTPFTQDNLDDTASKITALAWIKNRDAADNHMLFDRVRGVGKDMHSNDSAAEVTNANTVQRFLQRGVQIGSDVEVNTANESYVLWQWLLGNSATTGSANTDGSITSTVIAADAGHFSICTYTGTGANATIGHGLSGAPELVIVKNTNDVRAWRVLETVVNGGTHYLTLNTDAASVAGSTFWNNSNPTASVINLGSDTDTNDSGDTMLAISFRSVPGVCKVGSYIGNGNADGPYVSVGFKPKWLMVKWTGGGGLSAEGWLIKDIVRQTINPNDDAELYANYTSAESTGASHGADILSDGFKLRGAGGANNGNGATYLYLAIADLGGNGTLPPIYGR